MKYLSVARSLATDVALRPRRSRATRLRPLDVGPLDGALRDADLASVRAAASVGAASIASVQRDLAAAIFSAEQLTLHFLSRVQALDPTPGSGLGSILELNPEALDDARASDERRRSGRAIGPLDGIPITIKDNIDTAGPMRTTAGAMVLADHVADQDAPVVAALRAAGAVVLATANLSELAGAVARTPGVSAVGGRTLNPFGAAFSPGGSSSGSAVSVAAGFCLASVGTETCGSLIAPAAFNSVVAVKPSRGVLASAGIVPLVESFDTPGPIAGSVADAAALLAVMAGDPNLAEWSAIDALAGVTVGVLRADILAQRTPVEDTSDNEAMLQRITDGLTAAGARCVDATMGDPADAKRVESDLPALVFGGLAHDTVPYLGRIGAPVATLAELHAYNLHEPGRRIPWGQFSVDTAMILAPDAAAYRSGVADLIERTEKIVDDAFRAAGADVLVSLTNRHSPFYAAAGCPAVTVPIGRRSNGMPTGATFIGRVGDDASLLARAAAFEAASALRCRSDS